MADKGFVQLPESRASQKAYAFTKRLVTHIPHLFRALSDENYTLSHGDVWLNNVFVRHDHSHRFNTKIDNRVVLFIVSSANTINHLRRRCLRSRLLLPHLQYQHRLLHRCRRRRRRRHPHHHHHLNN
ncbi:unnamed protein product [Rotaria sp. Silwood2]|nr:unnamed protein product [Rotaria sp. Silwood2]